ncbi:MAG: caspase family protein [Bacteroidota bacterium]
MKTLYALLVAIDAYPQAKHALQGTLNDQAAMNEYLETLCKSQGLTYNPQKLSDSEATRAGIIKGFAHFKPAKADDICVFFFAGHGSRTTSFLEFAREDIHGVSQTLVCYDSRTTGGYDLIDKEIGHLIWEYTHKNKPHFLSIVDSCHASSITREIIGEEPEGPTRRMVDMNPHVLPLDQYVGRGFYRKDGDYLVPNQADNVALTACDTHESSHEQRIGGKKHGIFTYSLLAAIHQSNLAYLTYGEIIRRVRSSVDIYKPVQTPQLTFGGNTINKNSLFLSQESSPKSRSLALYEDNAWYINLGSMNGAKPGGKVEFENGESGQIDRIEPGRSSLSPESMKWAISREKEVFIISKVPTQKQELFLRFYEEPQTAPMKYCKNLLLEEKVEGLALWDENSDTRYSHWIRKMDGGLTLVEESDLNLPLFPLIPITSYQPSTEGKFVAIHIFMEQVQKIAHFREVRSLNNPLCDWKVEDKLKVEFFEVPDYSFDRSEKETLTKGLIPKNIQESSLFSYSYEENSPRQEPNFPAFVLRVTNISQQALWVAGLHFDNDFGITDELLPVKELGPGSQPYLFSYFHSDPKNSAKEGLYYEVPIYIPGRFTDQGIYEISNHIKIIISPYEFSTEQFVQEGMDWDLTRSIGVPHSFSQEMGSITEQWNALDISYRIYKPAKLAQVNQGAINQVGNIKIKPHKGFSAKQVTLNSSALESNRMKEEEGTRSIKAVSPFPLENMAPLNLLGIRGGNTMDMLEFHGVQNTESVHSEAPLNLELDVSLADNEGILPLGYDSDYGFFYPLGPINFNGDIQLFCLPSANKSSSTRGLFNSLSIYFQRIFYTQTLKIADPYPKLATVEEGKNEKVELNDNLEAIKRQVGMPSTQRILVLVHGIIGDNSDKANIIHRAFREIDGNRQDLSDIYDLCLTFDYDSLGVSIEENARLLKEKLDGVGLGQGHGKVVHLVAHSMGGLVTRYFLEKEQGDEQISHFIQVGTPNLGSPWANYYDMAMVGLGRIIGLFPIPGLINEILGAISKAWDKVEINVERMQKDSEFLQNLNSGAHPQIPYTIICGDVSKVSNSRDEALMGRIRQVISKTYRQGLDALVAGASDTIVAVDSMKGFTNKITWTYEPVIEEPLGCDHFTYFNTLQGIEGIAKVLFGLYDGEMRN